MDINNLVNNIKNEMAAKKTAFGYKLNTKNNEETTHFIVNIEQFHQLENIIKRLNNENNNIKQEYKKYIDYANNNNKLLKLQVEQLQMEKDISEDNSNKIIEDKDMEIEKLKEKINEKNFSIQNINNEKCRFKGIIEIQEKTIQDLYTQVGKLNYRLKNIANKERKIQPAKTNSGFVVLNAQDKLISSKKRGSRSAVIYIQTPIINGRDINAEYVLDFIRDQLGGMPYVKCLNNNCLRVGSPKEEYVVISVRLPEKISLQITLREYQAEIEELYSTRRKQIEQQEIKEYLSQSYLDQQHSYY